MRTRHEDPFHPAENGVEQLCDMEAQLLGGLFERSTVSFEGLIGANVIMIGGTRSTSLA